ncbi:hypothetical protein [Ligilactobacillus equi]|uniref:Uncharacterized protein n=1 Tax=Ligilactobacillus equi DSM 15833 = JCM 10991 TaxID=1423740 RepID=A0A0R1TAA8_9LACO|nr:hypothetical protein [Ligilactobacillus equi]KRL78257.1 hypothetical protein FC36_GL001146 [Ligilactobacillus equi DSM 15833 = JCM 10991]
MAEIDFIKKNAKKMSNQELLYYLPNQTVKTKHTLSSLRTLKHKLGITGGKKTNKGRAYNDFELRIIKSPKYTNKQASLHIGRTPNAIGKKRAKLREEGIIKW